MKRYYLLVVKHEKEWQVGSHAMFTSREEAQEEAERREGAARYHGRESEFGVAELTLYEEGA